MNSSWEFLRTPFVDLDLHAKLRLSVKQLSGISSAAVAALGQANIYTVFDLGTSNLFARARYAAELARAGADMAPADLLTAAQEVLASELGSQPLARLQGVSAELAAALQTALGIETIEDLAQWPPYRAALQMVRLSLGDTSEEAEYDAADLRPRFGQYPTERVFYETLSMFQSLGGPDRATELNGPVSLMPAVQTPGALSVPAIGAVLTFSQTWFAQGITLGHMLHALALAPGEATRIAVVDWSRRTSAASSEAIAETEQLDNTALHARAVSEVQSAVAKDMQSGGSRSSSTSSSESTARASAQGSGLVLSVLESFDESFAEQSASTSSDAFSTSWSMGTREVLASMTQNVNDRTEQHASSVRSRRATAIREVSQSEHESISSRVVANYNHMHALTVQYYEVVQVYRVVAALDRAERCVFLPVEALDFSEPNGIKVVERFRAALTRAALNRRIRSLLADDTTSVEVSPVERVRVPRPDVLRIAALFEKQAAAAAKTAARDTTPKAASGSEAPKPAAAPPESALPKAGFHLWQDKAAATVARILGTSLFRSGSDSLFVPDEAELIAIAFSGLAVKNVVLDRTGAGASADLTITVPEDTSIVDAPAGIRLADLESISIAKKDDAPQTGVMILHCSHLGRRFTLPDIPVTLKAGTAFQRVASLRLDQADRRRELLQHLAANRDYYTQAICRSLDSGAITSILSRHKLGGKPLLDQVEPKPLAATGSYLIFRAPVSAEEPSGISESGKPLSWGDLLKRRGVEPGRQQDQRLVPIPTEGVFAEAVLGRSNSAEKLDLTRFWNWQDSPIPLVPTEIQPQSRAMAEDLKPGQLSAPVLNIMNPTPLPEPAGLGASLNALANLNFRDMSGLAGTQALAQAGMAGTLDAASAAGAIASENLKTEAQKAVAMGQIAADIAKAAIAASGGGGGGAISSKNPSLQGAVLNHARSLDERSQEARPRQQQLPPPEDTAPVDNGEETGSPPLDEDGDAAPGLSREQEALDGIIHGTIPEAVSAFGSLMKVQNKKSAKAKSSTRKIGAVVICDSSEASNIYGQIYAKQTVKGVFKTIDTMAELRKLLSAYDSIDHLVILSHGNGSAIDIGGIGGEEIDLDKDPAVSIGLTKLPQIGTITLEGCNIGDGAAKLDQFGKAFQANFVYAWNFYHATGYRIIKGIMSDADLAASTDYKEWLPFAIPGTPTTAADLQDVAKSLAKTAADKAAVTRDGVIALAVEWFSSSGLSNPPSPLAKSRSMAVKESGTGAAIAARLPARTSDLIQVEVTPPKP